MLENLKKKYSPKESMPLEWYAATTVVFNALLAAGVLSASERGRERDGSIGTRDLVMMGMATHKLARTVSRDSVTSFVRAPFTRYREDLGYGEVSERVRYEGGVAQVVGELLSCSYCLSAWTGLGFLWGLSRFPRATRLLMGYFSAVTMADFLHVAYEEKRTRSNVLTLEEEGMTPEGGRPAAA
jgi:hypothetical protein